MSLCGPGGTLVAPLAFKIGTGVASDLNSVWSVWTRTISAAVMPVSMPPPISAELLTPRLTFRFTLAM